MNLSNISINIVMTEENIYGISQTFCIYAEVGLAFIIRADNFIDDSASYATFWRSSASFSIQAEITINVFTS